MSDCSGILARRLAVSRLGVDATFTPAAGAPISLRVVPRQPEAPFGGPDVPRSIARVSEVMAPSSSFAARPARGDGLSFGGDDYTLAEDGMLDARGASYVLRLRRA